MPDHDNPYPGFFEIFWGDEFAFLVAASPIGMNLAVLSGPPVLARAALPLLVLVQAVLVVADRWRLEGMLAGEAAPPALAWALFAPGYLLQRARALAHLRYAPVIWLLMLLVMLLPFSMLVFDPQDPRAAAASCDRPAAQVQVLATVNGGPHRSRHGCTPSRASTARASGQRPMTDPDGYPE